MCLSIGISFHRLSENVFERVVNNGFQRGFKFTKSVKCEFSSQMLPGRMECSKMDRKMLDLKTLFS